jgi:uncharacterized damage-inducible protein DinB
MFSKINHWEDKINAHTRDFAAAFSTLTDTQLNHKPSATVWSIAENIQHIIAVNESYYPVLAQLKSGTYRVSFLGQFSWMTKLFGNLIYNSVLRNRSRKMKTFPIWLPEKANQAQHAVLERFKAHHETLIQAIKGSSDLLEKGTVICSPANKNIVYTLERAFEIMIEHEERHFNQALEVKSTLK